MNNVLYPIRHWLVCLWVVAFVAFHLPWTTHKTAAFTLNAFDLGEQIRFHPAIVAESPTYRSSIFLWLAVPLTAGGLAFSASIYRNQRVRLLLWALAILFALRINPPKDGLQKLFEDDYAQAFTALTVIGLGLVGVAFLLRSVTWLWVIQIGLAVLSLLLPLSGFRRSWALLHELQVNVGLGAGVIIYLGALVGIIVLAANIKRPWREYQGRYGNQKT